MNLVLFTPGETAHPLPRSDARARHILDVLRRAAGDTFDAGIVNGPLGKATITEITGKEISFSFSPGGNPPALAPIDLVVGLPRPQTARDVLRDATTLGVRSIHFAATDKSEPGYAHSTLWRDGEWQRQLLAGAAQAFDTRIPEVTVGRRLDEVVSALPADVRRYALDNYEASRPLAIAAASPSPACALAIGSERGWSAREREILRASRFELVHLGKRVLRTETACIAAITLLKSATERV